MLLFVVCRYYLCVIMIQFVVLLPCLCVLGWVWVCVLFMQFSVCMLQIMKEYVFCFEQPRILGLTAPLLNSACDPGRLEGELRRLELVLHSAAETASDIVSVLR